MFESTDLFSPSSTLARMRWTRNPTKIVLIGHFSPVLQSIFTIYSRSSYFFLLCSPLPSPGLINFTKRSIGRATKRARRSRASKRADRRVGRYSIAPQGSSTAGATRSFARLRLRLRLVRPRHGRNSNGPLYLSWSS